MPPSQQSSLGPQSNSGDLSGQHGFLSQSLASVALKGASTLISFLTVLILARVLGTEAYGIYAVVFAVVSVISIPAALGTSTLVIRETARARSEGIGAGIREFWGRADALVLLTSLGLLALVTLWILYGDLQPGWYWAFLAGLALVPLRAFIALRGAMLRGMGRVVAGQLPEFLWRPGLFLCLIGALALMSTSQHLGAADALVVHSVAAALTLTIAMIMLRRIAPPRSGRNSPMAFRDMLFASGTMGLIAGAQVVNNNLDVVMLGALAESADAGIYKVAASCAMLAGFGLQAVNQALMPRVAANHKRGDRNAIQALVRQTARLSLLLAILVAMVLALTGVWFLNFAFGPDYEAGYFALLILLAGQVLNAAFGPVISILNMTGHERDTLQGVLVACAVNAVLNAILIPVYGIEGAAVATAATLISWNAMLFFKVRQRLGLNPTAFGAAKT